MVFGFFETSSHDDDEKQELRRQQQHHHHSTTASVSVRRHETTANSTTTSPSSNNNNSSKAVRNSFIAGWTAGVTGTLAGHPLDSLKVWVQTGIRPAADHVVGAATTATAGSPSPASILATVRRFYAGVSGPVVTVGLIQSINFAVYDTTRRFWYYHMDNPTTSSSTSSDNHIDPYYGPHQRDYLNQDSYTSVAVSGMAAGAVLSVVTAPILMIKTLQQTQRNMSFRDALRWTRRHPTTGFGVHFAVETLNRAVYFCTYEYLKRYFEQPPPPSYNINDKEQYHDGDDDATTTTPTMSLSGRMISAAAAGINCWAWLYPIDALRSRIYANMAAAADAAPISSGWAMAKIMYAEGGWRSFYRGFAITTLRAGPVAAAILPVYDYTLDALNNHNNNNNSTTF